MAIDLHDINQLISDANGMNDGAPIRAIYRGIAERWSVVPPNERPEALFAEFPLDVSYVHTTRDRLIAIRAHVLALAARFVNLDLSRMKLYNFAPPTDCYDEEYIRRTDDVILRVPVRCEGDGSGSDSGFGVYAAFLSSAVRWLLRFQVRIAPRRVPITLNGRISFDDCFHPDDYYWGDPSRYPEAKLVAADGTETTLAGTDCPIPSLLFEAPQYYTLKNADIKFSSAPIVFYSTGYARLKTEGYVTDIGTPVPVYYWTRRMLESSFTNVPAAIRIANLAPFRGEAKLLFAGDYGYRRRRGLESFSSPRRETTSYGYNGESVYDYFYYLQKKSEFASVWQIVRDYPEQNTGSNGSGGVASGTETDYTFDGMQSFSSAGTIQTAVVSGVNIHRENYFDSFGLVPYTKEQGSTDAPPPYFSFGYVAPHAEVEKDFASNESGGASAMPLRPDCTATKLMEECEAKFPWRTDPNDREIEIRLECRSRILTLIDYGEVYKTSAEDEPENWLGLPQDVWDALHPVEEEEEVSE